METVEKMVMKIPVMPMVMQMEMVIGVMITELQMEIGILFTFVNKRESNLFAN